MSGTDLNILFHLARFPLSLGFPGSSDSKKKKKICLQCRRTRFDPAWEDPLEKKTTTHSSILAWKTPWTEEPGGLQSMGLRRIRDDWATDTFTLRKTEGTTEVTQDLNLTPEKHKDKYNSLSAVCLFRLLLGEHRQALRLFQLWPLPPPYCLCPPPRTLYTSWSCPTHQRCPGTSHPHNASSAKLFPTTPWRASGSDSVLSLSRTQVPSLVGELRSQKPAWCPAKQNQTKQFPSPSEPKSLVHFLLWL